MNPIRPLFCSAAMLMFCLGCSSSETTSKSRSTAETLAEVDVETSANSGMVSVEEPDVPWTTELIPGRLTIGNPFPDVPLKSQVLGAPWEGLSLGKPTIVFLHSYHEAPDDDPNSPLNAIRTFSRTYTDQADEYRLLVLLMNSQIEPRALEKIASEFGESKLVSVANDTASFVQRGLIDSCADNGIPKVYAVGEDGIIDWIGSPEMFPDILASMAANKFDRRAAHEAYEANVAHRRPQFDATYQFANAMNLKEYNKANEVADARLVELPNDGFWLAMKYEALLKAERHDDINAVLKAMAPEYKDDAEWLADSAFHIAEGKAGSDLDLALDFAQQANKLSGEDRIEMMHGLALTHAKRNEFEQAVLWETKVVAKLEDGGVAMGLDKLLAGFKEKLAEQTSKNATTDDNAAKQP